jgi:uncharacterized protein (TIGR03083 family)
MSEDTRSAADRTRDAVDRDWGSAVDRLAVLDDDGWATPTRCAGWTVADLVRHTVWGVSMEADALRRVRLAEDGTADGLDLPRDTPPTELLARLREARSDLVDELGQVAADPGRPAPMPYGDVPVSAVLDVFVMEAAVHAGDVAHALGADVPLEPDAVAATAAVLAAFFPVFAANSTSPPADGTTFALAGSSVRLAGGWTDGALQMGDVDAPAVSVTGEDSPVLLFALGRLPADDPRLTVTGDAGLARAFKTYVPGP